MKIAAYILLALAIGTTQIAINNVFLGKDPDRPEETARFVGYVFGSFLIPVTLAIIGLKLLNKAKKLPDIDET